MFGLRCLPRWEICRSIPERIENSLAIRRDGPPSLCWIPCRAGRHSLGLLLPLKRNIPTISLEICRPFYKQFQLPSRQYLIYGYWSLRKLWCINESAKLRWVACRVMIVSCLPFFVGGVHVSLMPAVTRHTCLYYIHKWLPRLYGLTTASQATVLEPNDLVCSFQRA